MDTFKKHNIKDYTAWDLNANCYNPKYKSKLKKKFSRKARKKLSKNLLTN